MNASRAGAGLPPLTWSERLSQAAAKHAETMQGTDTVAHQLQDEQDLVSRIASSGVRFFVVAENIGVAPSTADLHDEWFRSQGHRENMLDASVNAVGIAVRGSGDEFWGVEDFAGTVEPLSLEEQEGRVAALLRNAGVTSFPSATARGMCMQSTGYLGQRPAFVMRFASTGLSRLPHALQERLQRGGISQAAVGACERPSQTFSSYSLAVALYR